ncbi:glutathione peroxidase [Nannochloropsis oceanica]
MALGFFLLASFTSTACAFAAPRTLYDFSLKDATGTTQSLAAYKDKPVTLIVNVASRCGYTDSNYKQLQTLYEKYQKDGLQIFAMPTNEFGGQEPGSDADIIKFTKDKYAVTFPVFSKLKVNGGDASEIYRWLKSETKDPPAETNKDIRWNFTKFLLVNGMPYKRFAHDKAPKDFESDIVTALRAAANKEL